MKHAFFITGTDTDAGKTRITSGLLAAAREQGMSTLGLKPVASGCTRTAAGLRNSDALALAAQSSVKLDYPLINPFAFEPAIAPHLAAQQAGIKLDARQLALACQKAMEHPADFCLIEGAGGWRVPLSAHETMADLAMALQLPVILVVGIRLGGISHALLTAEAIVRDGLQLAGWIANPTEPQMPHLLDNLITLEQHLQAPCLARLGWQPDISTPQLAQECLPALERILNTANKHHG